MQYSAKILRYTYCNNSKIQQHTGIVDILPTREEERERGREEAREELEGGRERQRRKEDMEEKPEKRGRGIERQRSNGVKWRKKKGEAEERD